MYEARRCLLGLDSSGVSVASGCSNPPLSCPALSCPVGLDILASTGLGLTSLGKTAGRLSFTQGLCTSSTRLVVKMKFGRFLLMLNCSLMGVLQYHNHDIKICAFTKTSQLCLHEYFIEACVCVTSRSSGTWDRLHDRTLHQLSSERPQQLHQPITDAHLWNTQSNTLVQSHQHHRYTTHTSYSCIDKSEFSIHIESGFQSGFGSPFKSQFSYSHKVFGFNRVFMLSYTIIFNYVCFQICFVE